MRYRLIVLILSLSFAVTAQTPPQGGVSTGPAATYTSRRTAGITDPNAPVVFEDVTDKTPLANFRHRSGEAAKDYIFETTTGGAARFEKNADARPAHGDAATSDTNSDCHRDAASANRHAHLDASPRPGAGRRRDRHPDGYADTAALHTRFRHR